jgi:hypothetical protein
MCMLCVCIGICIGYSNLYVCIVMCMYSKYICVYVLCICEYIRVYIECI